MQELLKLGSLMCAISHIEIFRLKQGADHVYLHTNLPNPRSPYQGGLSLHFMCDRGTGPDWVENNYQGVETHTYDHTIGRVTNGQNPARPKHFPLRAEPAEALLLEASGS